MLISVAGVAVKLWSCGCVGTWVVNLDKWESEAQIGGSRSAGRAKPSWTDLECLLGLLPNF